MNQTVSEQVAASRLRIHRNALTSIMQKHRKWAGNMAYEITFSDDRTVVRTEYSGEIDFKEMTDSYLERFSDTETLRGYRVILSDYTHARMVGLSADQVKALAEMSKQAEQHNPNVVVVGIMPRDLEYGLTRMWQAYSSESGWESQIFRTREEGEDFVAAVLNRPA